MTDTSDSGILSQGDVLNNTYVIAELVAQGGTGEVYRATNRATGREIAIKILKREFAQDEKFAELMRREASVLHEVIDPAVVRYYDLLESDMHGGFLFIVMEFIKGHSLADEMKARGPLDAGVLLKVAERVLQGLKAAHSKNAFHRDLSPDNIILRDGDPDQATLIDFGIAKDVNEGAKTVVGGGFAGKYQYASPEQMEGRVDARSDLYSLGMTLLGAYRGQAPLQGSSMMEIVKAKSVKPDVSDMTGTLHDLVDRLVEPNPDDRLQSAEAALQFLGGAAASPVPQAKGTLPAAPEATVVVPRGDGPRTVPPAHVTDAAMDATGGGRSRGGLWVLLVLLLAGGGGAGAYFSGLLDPYIGGSDPVVAGDTGGDLPVASTGTEAATEEADTAEAQPTTDTATAATEEAEAQPAEDGADTPPALPLAAPYRLSIERTSRADPVKLIGNLPSAEMQPEMSRDLEDGLSAFAILADVTPARGEPFDGWARMIADVAKVFAALDSFTVAAEDLQLVLIAEAANEAEKNALLAATWQVIEGSGLTIVDRIAVAKTDLRLSDLASGLRALETCGPLTLSGGANGVVGPTDKVTVSGQVATAADRTKLAAFLRQNAPGRAIETRTQVINPSVCNVLAQIPPEADTANMRIDYSYGTKLGSPPADTYHLGENPVIDVLIPADRDGFLNVAFVDQVEQVFHLLPHQARTTHRLSETGTVEGGIRRIRVAYPVSEASIEKLGFKVVEPLGTSIVLAIISDEPLFGDLRPRAESNAAYVAALGGRLKQIVEAGGEVAWRFLRTEP